MRKLRIILVAILLQITGYGTVWAQDVTLTSRDGSVQINGALVGYDGEFYRVDSVYGVLTVDGSGVICTGPGCPDLDAYVANIRLSGAVPIGLGLMPRLVESFAEHQEYDVEQQGIDQTSFSYVLTDRSSGRIAARFLFSVTDSDEGFADLLTEEADIAMSLREVNSAETLLGEEAGIGNLSAPKQSRVIALDALVPVVGRSNPVRSMSPTELYGIYTGEITNWQQLGGIDAPIELHLPSISSGISQVFSNYMAEENLEINEAVQRHGSIVEMVEAVAKDPFAIGVSVMSERGNARQLGLVGSCGFKSAATIENLKTEDYPLTAPMFVYFPSRRLPAIGRDFLRYLRSPAAQISVQRAGFAGQSLTEVPVSRQGERLANAIRSAGPETSLVDLQNMVKTLDGSRRLSVSFRFSGGSIDLDAQSRSNVVLVARALEAGAFDGREVLFVGFSDGEGSARVNLRISRQRAAAVRAAVLREAATADASRLSLKVEAFGEAMPMACDDTEWGRRVNRRVEVWVK